MYVLCLGLSFFPVTSLILGERASREQESAGTKLTPRCKIVGARAHADAALCVALPCWPILSRVINCKLFRLRNVAVVVVPVAVYEVGQRAANTIMPARRRQEEEGKKHRERRTRNRGSYV